MKPETFNDLKDHLNRFAEANGGWDYVRAIVI